VNPAIAAVPPITIVPRCWPDSTIVCLATGPSLTQADVDACRGRAKIIAIKHAIEFAPWADVLYACGADASQWWPRYGHGLHDFPGLRFTLDPKAAAWATVLKETGVTGLERDPSGLKTGRCSGIQAINLAVHLGASTIVLLGYDNQSGPDGRDHVYGANPSNRRPPYDLFLRCFETLVEPLAALGVTVVNASRVSALYTFPRVSLEEALG
jgi:hypothetical protein